MKLTAQSRPEQIRWLFLLLGLCILYVPTISELAEKMWVESDQSHGYIVLAVILWLFYKDINKVWQTSYKPLNIIGGIIFAIGLIIYVLGRSQDVMLIQISSLIPVITGLLLMVSGISSVKILWFPLFFIIFMIPLPGYFIDFITMPMKTAVSYVAETILYNIGFPIARSGVILQIGSYQLFVANACAGLQTLISLEAMGLLYLNLVKHDSAMRNIVLAILIVPISFIANVIRVMVLTLITYYFGDEVGQGFVHGFAGIVLFAIALVLITSIDTMLQFLVTNKPKKTVFLDK